MKSRALRLDVADGAMLAVVLMWATNHILVKTTVDELPPLPFVVGRLLTVSLLVWGWLFLRRSPWRVAGADLPLLVLTGIAGFGVNNALFTLGIERTSAFSAALLLSLSPVFTLLFARVARIERPTAAQWLAVALAAAGVAIFAGGKLHGEGFGGAIVGDALLLLAAILFAVYGLTALPLSSRYGATVTTAWAVAIGLVAIAPWGIPASLEVPWRELTPAVWGGLLYAGAVSMLIGYTLWAWAMVRAGVARTVPYLFLVPVVTGVISAAVLGEQFGPLKLGGAALVLVGTTLVRVLERGSPVPSAAPVPAPPDAAVAGGLGPAPPAKGRAAH